jgi:hypothetical protein
LPVNDSETKSGIRLVATSPPSMWIPARNKPAVAPLGTKLVVPALKDANAMLLGASTCRFSPTSMCPAGMLNVM